MLERSSITPGMRWQLTRDVRERQGVVLRCMPSRDALANASLAPLY